MKEEASTKQLCTTYGLLESSNSSTLLACLRRQLEKQWQITVQSPIRQHTGMAIIINHGENGQSVSQSVPKYIQSFLTIAGYQDCRPALTSQVKGHDTSRRKPDEAPLSAADHEKYQEALGVVRFIADSVGYKIALATLDLAAHSIYPGLRHMQVFMH